MQQQKRGRRRTGYVYNDSSPRSLDSRVGRDSRRDDKRRSILPSPDPTPFAGTVRGYLIERHGEDFIETMFVSVGGRPKPPRRRRPRRVAT